MTADFIVFYIHLNSDKKYLYYNRWNESDNQIIIINNKNMNAIIKSITNFIKINATILLYVVSVLLILTFAMNSCGSKRMRRANSVLSDSLEHVSAELRADSATIADQAAQIDYLRRLNKSQADKQIIVKTHNYISK